MSRPKQDRELEKQIENVMDGNTVGLTNERYLKADKQATIKALVALIKQREAEAYHKGYNAGYSQSRKPTKEQKQETIQDIINQNEGWIKIIRTSQELLDKYPDLDAGLTVIQNTHKRILKSQKQSSKEQG